jgi:NAD+ kinase
MQAKRIAVLASATPEAQEARARLIALYGDVPLADADVIVALGGDGLMLQALHDTMKLHKPVYGMNRGSIGFLMNDFALEGLIERLERAEMTEIRPLVMRSVDSQGHQHEGLAINEVALVRETRQTAKIRILIDGEVRLPELQCDGVLVATPAGSTAYNLSAHGPVLPIDSQLLALTPISAFRPRRWHGALLPHRAHVRFEVLEADKRPVRAEADQIEVRGVQSVEVEESRDITLQMLFDKGHSLRERVLAEQFSP